MPRAVPDPPGLFLAGISSSCAEVYRGQCLCHLQLPKESDSGFFHPLTRKEDSGKKKKQLRVCMYV